MRKNAILAIPDGNLSFPSATRHLFRHLHDVKKLRRNPIAARFFDDPRVTGFGTARERSALVLIHALVRDAADYFRDVDLRDGKSSAFRGHVIILHQCLGRQDIKIVAEQLGMSTNACYRERARICRRVAAYLLEHSNVPTLQFRPCLDDFQLDVDRVVRATMNGDEDVAFRKCDGLFCDADVDEQKIEALALDVAVSLHFGNMNRARRKLREAEQVLKGRDSNADSTLFRVARARIDCSKCLVAHRLNESARAVEEAEHAISRLKPILTDGPGSVKQLYVECLNERAAGLWNLGDFGRAYDSFAEAERGLSSADRRALLGAQVTVQLWRARNRLVMSAKSWFPVWRRIEGLQEVFYQAYSFGAMAQAIEALEGLSEVYAFSGNDSEALRSGRLAIEIAERQGSQLLKARTMLSVAQRLLCTSYASYALSLAASVEVLNVADAVSCSRLRCLAAERALRLHKPGEAWRLATVQSQRPEPMEIDLRNRIVAALSSHELGWSAEALSNIDYLVSCAERLASAPILLEAYRAARVVTGNRSFTKKANEISDLLTA